MVFSSQKRWPARLKLLHCDTIEDERAPAMPSIAPWPTSSAANLSKLPQEAGVKMISTPQAYYATYDTMPPPYQGVCMEFNAVLQPQT
ncbi:hypothetical protein KXD40_005514 [Peronospora effusa]|nr:hypothetical protein KXD40_005514 [Peronospora effusa]